MESTLILFIGLFVGYILGVVYGRRSIVSEAQEIVCEAILKVKEYERSR